MNVFNSVSFKNCKIVNIVSRTGENRIRVLSRRDYEFYRHYLYNI